MSKFLATAPASSAIAATDLAAIICGQAARTANTPRSAAPIIGRAVAAVRRAGEATKASDPQDPALPLLRSAWESLKAAQRGLPRLGDVHYAHLRKAAKATALATGR